MNGFAGQAVVIRRAVVVALAAMLALALVLAVRYGMHHAPHALGQAWDMYHHGRHVLRSLADGGTPGTDMYHHG